MKDYDTMSAGAELDRLVAEKVMGWTYLPHWKGPKYYPGGWIIQDDRLHGHTRMENKFHPSTNIAHAWEVMEKLREEWAVSLGTVGYKRDGVLMEWAVRCQMGDAIGPDAAAPTAPLAICLCALKAVAGGG